MKRLLFAPFFVLSFYCSIPSVFAAEQIQYRGSSTVASVMTKIAYLFEQKENIELKVQSTDSMTGIEMILAGKCDVAGVGLPITKELKAKGLVATELFVDAYAVIANKEVALDSVSPEQLGDLLNGRVTSWDDLTPGRDHRVKIVAPPLTSAHYKDFQQIFNITSLPKGTIFADMTPYVFDGVERHPRAIGWLSYSTIYSHLGKVKTLGIQKDGKSIFPGEKSVTLDEYPYTCEQFLYTRGEPSSKVKKLINYLQSADGMAIIHKSGFFEHHHHS